MKWYIAGHPQRIETWQLTQIPNIFGLASFKSFPSKKEARMWVLKTLRHEVKTINKTISKWMHDAKDRPDELTNGLHGNSDTTSSVENN